MKTQSITMIKNWLINSAIIAAFTTALLASSSAAQSVLVNYDFATATPGTGCSAAPLTIAPEVTAEFSVNTGSCATPTGAATITPPAFAGNAANQAVSVQNSDITPAYFQFKFSGSNLAYYARYKVHLQAQRTGRAPIIGVLQYSTDGVNFTDFQTFDVSEEFTPFTFDLSSGVSNEILSHSQTVYIRVVSTTEGRTSGNFRIDNFQLQGQLAPSAAGASISGRVVNSNGGGLKSVTVILMGSELSEPRYARSNSMGYYEFRDLPVGQTYVLAVSSGRYIFESPTIVVNLNDSFSEAFFISEEWSAPAAVMTEPRKSACSGKCLR